MRTKLSHGLTSLDAFKLSSLIHSCFLHLPCAVASVFPSLLLTPASGRCACSMCSSRHRACAISDSRGVIFGSLVLKKKYYKRSTFFSRSTKSHRTPRSRYFTIPLSHTCRNDPNSFPGIPITRLWPRRYPLDIYM